MTAAAQGADSAIGRRAACPPIALLHGVPADLTGLFLELHRAGLEVAGIFWGLWLIPFGLLIIRSGFIPKAVGQLLESANCRPSYGCWSWGRASGSRHDGIKRQAFTFSDSTTMRLASR